MTRTVSPRGRNAELGIRPTSTGAILLRLVVAVILIAWLVPTVGLLVTSLRPELDAKFSGWWTVLSDPHLTLDNYTAVLGSSSSGFGLGRAFLNTLAIAIPSTLIPLTVAAYAAYAFSWMRFPGRNTIFAVVVALVIVPGQIALIPLLSAFTNGVDVFGVAVLPGIGSRLVSLWLVHTAYGLPLACFIMRTFMASLPPDLTAAARVDGASDQIIFRRIVLPLSVPAIASFAIFQFLWIFNDFLGPSVFLGVDPEVAPITVRLVDLAGSRGEDRHLLSAGAFVSLIVPLAVFLALQRYFVRGLTAGAVKD